MNRKTFFRSGITGALGISFLPGIKASALSTENTPLDPSVVKEFVVAGHGDLKKTRTMLRENPNLLYARHDWGNGDFEEAIEGAGHTGNREIAEFLIREGARVNLFTLAMLGRADLVIPVLEAYPNLVYAKGPHGFSLLHHASVGDQEAAKIKEYLTDRGLSEKQFKL